MQTDHENIVTANLSNANKMYRSMKDLTRRCKSREKRITKVTVADKQRRSRRAVAHEKDRQAKSLLTSCRIWMKTWIANNIGKIVRWRWMRIRKREYQVIPISQNKSRTITSNDQVSRDERQKMPSHTKRLRRSNNYCSRCRAIKSLKECRTYLQMSTKDANQTHRR
jgi:hypothetical protein